MRHTSVLSVMVLICAGLALACAPAPHPSPTPFGLPTATAPALPTLPAPPARPATPSNAAVTRAVIFLDGLGSSSDGAPKAFADLAQGLAPLYKRVLFFSYKKDSTSYAGIDTFKPIQDNVALLQAVLDAELKKDPTLRFDLVGNSLGGVIAFEMTKKLLNERNPMLYSLGNVVAMHSPVNGSLLLRSAPLWPDWVTTIVEKVWSPGARQSQAAKDLGDMNRNEMLPAINAQYAQSLLPLGVRILSIASKDDVVICLEDATLPGATKVYALGNRLPPNSGVPCALLVNQRVDVSGDAGQFVGHNQALHSQAVIGDLKAALAQ